MNFGGVSFFNIMCEALWPRFLEQRVGMRIALASAVVLTLMLDILWGALLGLLVAGSLLWRGHRHGRQSTDQTDRASAGPNCHAGPRHPPSKRPAPIIPIVDRFQSRHSLGKEAQLAKAGVLWHLYGDRHGARGHCLDLLGKMHPEDPLFVEVWNLLFRTCQTPVDRTVSPAGPLAIDVFDVMPSMPVTDSGAKVIPFRSRGAGAASLH